MDIQLRRDVNKWLDTASDEQLETTLLELITAVNVTFTEPAVIAEARSLIRAVRAEMAIRPHARFLSERLPPED